MEVSESARSDSQTSFGGKFFKSKRVRICIVIVVLIIGFFANFSQHEEHETNYLIAGGIIGGISSFAVMLDIWVNSRESAMQLLFWRSFSDLGIAIRFMASFSLNKIACGHRVCYLSSGNNGFQNNCAFPSTLLEFFEIASEIWFLCFAIDLWKSLINPFSSTKSWMGTYHAFVWGVSLIFAIPTAIDSNIYGYWFIANSIDNTAICWLRAHKGSVSTNIYLMFYIPLVLVYIFAVLALVIAYRRLRRGISNTIIHRMKALVVNSINVMIYLLYWLVLGVCLGLAYGVPNKIGQRWMQQIILYLISAKGVSAVIVWILTVDVHFEKNADADDAGVDLNGALRQELLYFATTGIRSCAGASVAVNQKRHVVHLRHKMEKSSMELSPWFFVFLILGRDQERSTIAKLARAARRKKSVRGLSILEEAVRAEGNSIVQVDAPDNSEPDTLRFSERPTMVAGIAHVESNIPMMNLKREKMSTSERLSEGSTRHSELLVTNYGEAEEADGFQLFASIQDFFIRNFGDGRSAVEFVEIEPYHFRRVRTTQRVSEEEYIEQFRTTIKERVTQGGASGAFFFFSRDEKFIAKSCTEEELGTLTKNAKAYADYFESERGKCSYISKIFGAYTLRIYGISLHFFVMNNLFYGKDSKGQNLAIHEKYDIKGSTVNRSAAPPFEGQVVTCTHCEQKFTYHRKKKAKQAQRALPLKGKVGEDGGGPSNNTFLNLSSRFDLDLDDSFESNRCTVTVSGHHEPNVILKDNDLKYKIRLPRQVARALQIQLENDAIFLRSIDVMDYSLLVGVHNTEYFVRDEFGVDCGQDFQSTEQTSNPILTSTQVNLAASGKVVPSRRLEVSRVVGPDSYQMGIIDFQQQWNFSKKLERFTKIQFQGADPYGLSAIAPDIYRDRFVNHIKDILDVEEERVDRSESTSNFVAV